MSLGHDSISIEPDGNLQLEYSLSQLAVLVIYVVIELPQPAPEAILPYCGYHFWINNIFYHLHHNQLKYWARICLNIGAGVEKIEWVTICID